MFGRAYERRTDDAPLVSPAKRDRLGQPTRQPTSAGINTHLGVVMRQP